MKISVDKEYYVPEGEFCHDKDGMCNHIQYESGNSDDNVEWWCELFGDSYCGSPPKKNKKCLKHCEIQPIIDGLSKEEPK